MFEVVLDLTPPGDTREGIARASRIPLDSPPGAAANQLGSGERVLCADTVPFSLWCVARSGSDYVEALWTTVAGLGVGSQNLWTPEG